MQVQLEQLQLDIKKLNEVMKGKLCKKITGITENGSYEDKFNFTSCRK